jgi:hypothetical protein
MYESAGCTKVEGPKVEDRLYIEKSVAVSRQAMDVGGGANNSLRSCYEME